MEADSRRSSQSLNDEVWCTLAPSKIQGVGVHAIRDIPKGQKLFLQQRTNRLYNSLDNLRPDIRAIIVARWPLSVAGGSFLSPNDDVFLGSFINHGEPNYDYKTDTALRDIQSGEEILEDYALIETHKQAFPWLDQQTTHQSF